MNERGNGYKIILLVLAVAAAAVVVGAVAMMARTPMLIDTQETAANSIVEAIPEDETVEALQAAENTDADEPDSADTEDSEDVDAADTEESEEGSTEDAEANDVNAPALTDQAVAASITASDELTTLLSQFLTENGLNTSNFSLAFKDLTTGETCYFNELTQMDAASTYKLPLNMIYYDMQAEGTITGDTIVPGTSTALSECHHQSLEFSNNELSEAMVNNYGSYDTLKRAERKYMTLSDAETDDSYYHHNYYCARQMMDVAAYLYAHQSQYSEALYYLKAAQPGQFFKRQITDCEIAQKYGQRDGWLNCAGIVYSDHPFVLAVYSHNIAGGEPVLGKAARLFYDYTYGTLTAAQSTAETTDTTDSAITD